MRYRTCFLSALLLALPAIYEGSIAKAADYDVRNYGAACNGTADDSRALQAAFNAVPATGGTVLIPCKLGIGSSGVKLSSKSDVTVRGTVAGAGIRALAQTGIGMQGFGPILFLVQYCTRCTISDLEFDGNKIGVVVLEMDRCTQSVVRNNYVHDVGQLSGGAISASGNTRNQYIGNRIVNTSPGLDSYGNNAARGMWLGNGADAIVENYPLIAQNTLQNIGHTGIAVHAIGATIQNNTVDGTKGAGVKLVPPPGATAPALIENNVLRRNLFHGIQLENVNGVTVRGNTIEQNNDTGIYAVLGIRNSVITKNIVRDNNFDGGVGGWAGGIWLFQNSGCVVSENTLYDTRTGSARTQDHGIIVNTAAAAQNLQIINNSIKNHSMDGIAIQTTSPGTLTGITLVGNTVTGNAQYGMLLREGTSGSIRSVYDGGNTWTPNGLGAIWDNTSSRVSDTTPPAVGITAPAKGSTVSGTVQLTASASDNVAVSGVQYRVDGANLGSAVAVSPYALAWDTTKFNSGSHTITAAAVDGAGNQTVSAGVVVTVNNSTIAPLSISGIGVSSITASSATVSWTTNQAAYDLVEYGPTASYGLSTTYSSQAVVNHAVALTNLTASTLYHYRITSNGANGGQAISPDWTFTTTASGSTPTTTNTVVINAYGTPCAGVYPTMELRMGTTVLQRWTVTGTAQNYTFTTTTPLTSANLRVYFTNDFYDAAGDRNLYVNSLTLNTKAYPTTASTVYTSSVCQSGYRQFIGIYCNGYFEYPTIAPAKP